MPTSLPARDLPVDEDSASPAGAAALLERWALQLGCTAEELRSAIGEAGRAIQDTGRREP